MTQGPVRVAAAQIAADVTQPPTAERLVEAVRAAAAEGVDLIVLPELAPSGCCFRDRNEARAAAEPLDGPSVSALRGLSRELPVTIVAGVALRDGDLLSNAAVVMEGGDVLGVYRKTHLWAEEKLFFSPAEEGPLLVSTRCGVVAVLICYDLEFPELVRRAAEAGAHIVTTPANWPVINHPPDQPAIEVVKAQAAAAYYGVFVVVADRCGDERGTRWVGGTSIIAPTGYLLAGPATAPGETARPALLWADIDPSAADDKSLGAYNDRLRDRRQLLYDARS